MSTWDTIIVNPGGRAAKWEKRYEKSLRNSERGTPSLNTTVAGLSGQLKQSSRCQYWKSQGDPNEI